VEDNDYTCCPVTSGNSVNNLIREYKRFHQLEIDAGDWQTALIQFAIPYARERVVVVAPGKFRISRKLHALAKRRKVSLDLLPLTTFPAVRIAEMRKRISVPSMDQDGCIFPKETEIVLGQSADQYMNLLPVYMQNQLKK
jgi:hypothetical protein